MDVPETLSQSRHLFRALAALLIIGAAFVRLVYFASPAALDLSPDEAHYWDWSRHLDWSYYSKGPLVACLIRASCAATGQAMLSVRLPAVICGSLLLVSLYVLTALVFRREGLALGLVGMALTIPLISVGSSLMTIDAPYTCCWGWALVFGYLAVFREKLVYWLLMGAMIALGILAKYTMILWVPSLALFLWFTPGLRRHLFGPGFWGMALVGALGGLPILWWNWQHDWVSWRHLQGHAGLQDNKGGIHWLGPLNYVGLQFALLLGYWFIVWFLAMWVHRPWGNIRHPAVGYLWWMSAPMFLFFLGFSFKNGGGEANWPVTAYLSGLVLAAAWLTEQLRSGPAWYRLSAQCWLILFCGIGLGLTLLIHQSSLAYPWLARLSGPASLDNPLPLRRLDPTCRLQGWRTLAAAVDLVRNELAAKSIEPVLAGSGWTLPGEVGFYCQGQPAVYSLGPVFGDRHSQYDLWRPNPVHDGQEFLGRTFILVGSPTAEVRAAFGKVEASRSVTHCAAGQPINQWTITVAHDFRGFPMPKSLRGF